MTDVHEKLDLDGDNPPAEAGDPGGIRAMAEERFGPGSEADYWIRLLAKGLVARLPPAEARYTHFEPVHVEGPPVSETILQERR